MEVKNYPRLVRLMLYRACCSSPSEMMPWGFCTCLSSSSLVTQQVVQLWRERMRLEDHKDKACLLHSELQWLHSNKTDQTAFLFFLTGQRKNSRCSYIFPFGKEETIKTERDFFFLFEELLLCLENQSRELRNEVCVCVCSYLHIHTHLIPENQVLEFGRP